MTEQDHRKLSVVVAGGGVAALEALLALRTFAGERVELTLLAPDDQFSYRALSVREPFAYGPAERYPIADLVAHAGARQVRDRFAWVDAHGRVAHTEGGLELAYDALLLAVGARPYIRFPRALTLDDRRLDDQMHGVIQDVEGGYARRLAFVFPARSTWPLPLYELALMTARRAHETAADIELQVITPEDVPLAIFGDGASEVTAGLLRDAGIKTITNAYAEVPEKGVVTINPGARRIEVDRVITLPELVGPAVRGLPAARDGFIPVDPSGHVRGLEHVFAAGDATDFPVKQGGLATQQADAAASAIAVQAGAAIVAEPFHPIIHGMFLTGGEPLYLTAHITGGHGFRATITDTPQWAPTTKVASRFLAPYLEHEAPSAATR